MITLGGSAMSVDHVHIADRFLVERRYFFLGMLGFRPTPAINTYFAMLVTPSVLKQQSGCQNFTVM